MEVKILDYAFCDIVDKMYVAAKTCYSEKSPINIKEPSREAKIKLLNKVLKSGHTSIAEHVQITFAIEGISRACSHQLVRHRHCTFSQQSQRYCNSVNCDFIVPDNLPKEAYIKIGRLLNLTRQTYGELVDELGVKKEDARCILPNCTSTNITMSCNLRELMHMCGLRMCNRAQKEIRDLFKEIAKQVTQREPFLKPFLQPKCEQLGFCDEDNSCGRKPKL